ncbi:hypothetical protein DMN91_009418 [Ooceraea biroi]|uniref:Uncharacterized protein n=1 Tax=Ooceraea biroi TaxID=2015173 RepID=A0A3L8DF13_OOCBI|nr:uncharacterized protein LOC105275146 [Ooceraea biroi]RLU19060.1 hypothetical protein DMN91_009418 [Ooceraea biroi]
MVLDDLETSCMDILDFDIRMFCRYVDDVFMILPTDKINYVLDIFNNYHPRLKFTVEIESNDYINFLDTTVIRENGLLITNWYRKPSFTGRYINYFASNPVEHKISIVTGLIDRAVLLSDSRFHDENVKIVKKVLRENCYPSEFIEKYVHKRLKTFKHRRGIDKEEVNDNNNRRGYASIPFVKGLSEGMCNILRKCDFKVAYSVYKKLDMFIKRGKDKLLKKDKTGVVYRIKCMECEACYIGQTKRQLETRIKEHKNDIRKGENNWSVVSRYRVLDNHDFDWDNVDIVHEERYLRKREIAEMIFIKRDANAINHQKDIENLPCVYDKIVTNV